MTKAEQAQMEALRVRLALCWTDPPKPIDTDVALEASGGKAVAAWCSNAHSLYAYKGWFKGHLHSRDADISKAEDFRSTASQGRGGPWFDTKQNALRWARHEAEKRMAAELRKVDAWIEADVT